MTDNYTPPLTMLASAYVKEQTARNAYKGEAFCQTPEELQAEFDRAIADVTRTAGVEALREAVADMRQAHVGGFWNLPDPVDPETYYSPDRWLEVRADRQDGTREVDRG